MEIHVTNVGQFLRNSPRTIVLFIFFCTTTTTIAQKKVDIDAQDQSIGSVLKSLSEEYSISFFYSNDLKDLKRKVTIHLHQVTIEKGMYELLKGTNLVFKFVNQQILIKKKTEVDLSDKEWKVPEEKKIKLRSPPVQKAKIVRVSGYVRNTITQEEIIGATITSIHNQHSVVTNSYGYYSLMVNEGKQQLKFSITGYDSEIVEFVFSNDTIIDKYLTETATFLQTVIISSSETGSLINDIASKKELNFEKTMSKGSIANDDIIDNIKLQAGIQAKNEGSTGYSVRGGGLDQNLILIDGAPVFNESHFLSLLSIFNTNSIKKATLYKSGLPAEFGSRLSSILDIQMKDGNKENFNYYGAINPFFMDYSMEGPLQKERSSFFVSGRNSLFDFIIKPVLNKDLDVEKVSFYDFNMKLNYAVNDRNKVFISGYFGRDLFRASFSDYQMNESWGNLTSSAKWNHVITPKLFSNAHLIFSNYVYNNVENYDDVNYFIHSKINSATVKYGITYYATNSQKIVFGLQSQIQKYEPGDQFIESTVSQDSISQVTMRFNNTLESALYLQDEIKMNEKVTFTAGLRYSFFNHFGKGTNYIFVLNNSIDTINKTGFYNFYAGLEPRLKVNYKLSSTSLITISYDRTYQYISLASNSISRSPTDIWVPSTNNLKPQNMNLYTISYNYMLDSSKYLLNTSVYYKQINNVVDFIDNAYLKLNQLIESQMRQGKASSYGLELSFSKISGKINYSINYQLSKATYSIADINNGKPYYAPYHKLHSANLNVNYKFSDRLGFQSTVVLTSGARTTFPVAIYYIQGTAFTLYNERNADALPVYFRLDVSLTYHLKDKKWGKHDLLFAVYNALNRKNPYSISFEQNTTKAYYNYLLPIIPSLTYKIHLK